MALRGMHNAGKDRAADFRDLLQNIIDAAHGRRTPLEEVCYPSHCHHGPCKEIQITDKGDKIAR